MKRSNNYPNIILSWIEKNGNCARKKLINSQANLCSIVFKISFYSEFSWIELHLIIFFPQTIFSRYPFSISKFHQIKMMDVVKPKSLYSAYHIFDLDQKIFFATPLPGPGTVYLHIWSTLQCPAARGGPLPVCWKSAENETFVLLLWTSKVTKVVISHGQIFVLGKYFMTYLMEKVRHWALFEMDGEWRYLYTTAAPTIQTHFKMEIFTCFWLQLHI